MVRRSLFVVTDPPFMLETFHTIPWLYIGLAVIVGLCFGSFSNVVIHRLPVRWDRELTASVVEWADLAIKQPELGLPRVPADKRGAFKSRLEDMAALLRELMGYLPDETLSRPRSRCPSCGHGITALENIPLLSWLALRGKCSACKTPISVRYPLVEAFCGLMAGVIAWRFGPTPQGIGALILFFWLLPLALIDAETTWLPNQLTLPLLWLGLLFNVFRVYAPLEEAIFGAVVGYLFLAIPAFTMEWLRKMDTHAMGRGDFVLLALAGAWFGWSAVLPVALLSSCVGVLIYVPLAAVGKRDLASKIPFGPYIAGAIIAYLFFGASVKGYFSSVLM